MKDTSLHRAKHYLKASALYYAVVISLLIALTSGSLIMMSYYFRLSKNNFLTTERLMLNAQSGFNLLQADKSFDTRNETLDLYGKGQDSVWLNKRLWGLYQLNVANAITGNKQQLKAGLVGLNQSVEKTSLYFANNGKPISIAGNTYISGNAYIPKAGINRAYIEGKSYSGRELVFGNKFESEKNLPALLDMVINQNSQFFGINLSQLDTVMFVESNQLNEPIIRSFAEPTLYIYSVNSLSIGSSGKLVGNIVILCDAAISIRSNAQLSDVLIYANQLEVASGFKGSFQAFVQNKIDVAANVDLTYPSTLAVFSKQKKLETRAITIGKSSSIFGSIIYLGSATHNIPAVWIENDVHVMGAIYSEAMVGFKGDVSGSMWTTGFYLKTGSGTYINYLLDAEINRDKLAANYSIPFLITSIGKREVAKWLN